MTTLLLFCLASLAQADSHPQNKVSPAVVEGTRLIVTRPDGTKATGKDLIGAVIVGQGADGHDGAFRIDKIETYEKDPEIHLYQFSTRDPATGQWKQLCDPDPHGLVAGFPLAGTWDTTGTHLHNNRFTITCTSGVLGKCVMFGYKPWGRAKDGHPMWDYHEACTRMMRADYCGNGKGHTKNGTIIDLVDRFMEKDDVAEGMKPEAGWTTTGASCVAKPRWPGIWPLETIIAECPAKLKGHAGPLANCDKAEAFKDKNTLIFNRSK